MNAADLEQFLHRARAKTLELLDAVERAPDPPALLGWRPGPGRAHLAWQLMHIAATEDRHLHLRMLGGEPGEPAFVQRFASGSVPDDDIPSVAIIRKYLADRRDELLAHLRGLSPDALATKPHAAAPYAYADWFEVLALHEPYHHGQAHLTYNLFRATQDPRVKPVGH